MISDFSILDVARAPASIPANGESASLVHAPTSALLVPHGAGGASVLASHEVVLDVKKYLAGRATAVPQFELEELLFWRLPLLLRGEVRRLQAAVLHVRDLTAGKAAIKVQPACVRALAIYPEFRPLKTFRAKYDLWVKRQDWLVLVNHAKAGADWQQGERGLPDAFLDGVAARMGDFRRADAGAEAIRSLKRQWRTGRNHRGQEEVIPGYEKNWRDRNPHIEPDGWHPANIRAQLKKRAKFSKAVKALRHEGIAAAKNFVPQVHGTRRDLRFMELVQFDDVRCDFRVIDTETGQICDLWLLIARDVATTMLLGFGMRPALAREDGSQSHLKLRDMKQLCGWLLEIYGLPPWTMEWVLENGTATLQADTRAALAEILSDKISFHMASMIGGKSAAGYWEKAVGNSKAKAMLESLNRLIHIMASHLPGQIGLNYSKRPAELAAREAEAKEIWRAHRAEDRADLIYPVLTIPQAREHLFKIFREQNLRTDHNCEGFEKVVEAFDGKIWTPATGAHTGCPVRARMESPVERAVRLSGDPRAWTRVSPEVLTAFYEHSHRARPVEANGEIVFMHEGKKLRFAPPAPAFALPPETKVLGYFNPDDPRFLTLTDGRGGILGTWLRRGLVAHNDREALAAAIRHSTAALNGEKARAHELAAGERAELDAMREHNAGFVTVYDPSPIICHPSISSPVAAQVRAVAGEKNETKKQRQRRLDANQVAREALRNLAA